MGVAVGAPCIVSPGQRAMRDAPPRRLGPPRRGQRQTRSLPHRSDTITIVLDNQAATAQVVQRRVLRFEFTVRGFPSISDHFDSVAAVLNGGAM